MKLENLSDKDLAKIAVDIKAENKRRAKHKAAATAIVAILKKHDLSIDDLREMALEKRRPTTGRKRSVATKATAARTKTKFAKKSDKRVKVAQKYKNLEGSDRWSGRGRPPKWVVAILKKNNISIAQFKADRRYTI